MGQEASAGHYFLLRKIEEILTLYFVEEETGYLIKLLTGYLVKFAKYNPLSAFETPVCLKYSLRANYLFCFASNFI